VSICNPQGEPEIESAFYFDLALRTFLAIKSILSSGSWPPNMKYLTCDEYDGTNSPEHTIDLRTAFSEVKIAETARFNSASSHVAHFLGQ
jgi:glutamate receptor, ionotropic, invertebrate